jgi:GNAT superfamily N-acetyltransferase
MIEIDFLVNYPEVIPTLTHWFYAQWPEYYAERTPADIAQDFFSEANRDGIPVRLVAFADGELAGTITLRDQALWTLPEYHPGLGGLLVVERHRGRGIGTELVRAGMNVAREQGYERVYATTVMARGILEHLGWKLVQAVSHGGEQLLLYCCELEERGPTQRGVS